MGTTNQKLKRACEKIQGTVSVIDRFQKTVADVQRYANHGNRGQVKMIMLDKLRQEREAVEKSMEDIWAALQVIVNEMQLAPELIAEEDRREGERKQAQTAEMEAKLDAQAKIEVGEPGEPEDIDETTEFVKGEDGQPVTVTPGNDGQPSTDTANADDVPGESTPTGDEDRDSDSVAAPGSDTHKAELAARENEGSSEGESDSGEEAAGE